VTLTAQAPVVKRPARPFLPKVPRPNVPVLTSTASRATLIAVLALAYVLQFGLGILTAITVFLIR
jgi:hypothetical protein